MTFLTCFTGLLRESDMIIDVVFLQVVVDRFIRNSAVLLVWKNYGSVQGKIKNMKQWENVTKRKN